MKAFFILFCLLSFLTSYCQEKDTLLTKVREADDYSNSKKKPASANQVTIRDRSSKKEIENPDILKIYNEMTGKAETSFKKKDYESAITFYQLAFKLNNDQGKVRHRYNLACCYAVLNHIDLAFIQLERIAFKGGYYNHFEISQEKTFDLLHNDPRWKWILEKVRQNAYDIQDKLNKELKIN